MIIPTMNVSDIQRALDFYTGVLDFSAAYVWSDGGAHGYAVLRRGNDELHLSGFGGRAFEHAAIVVVPEVDDLYRLFLDRGLDPSGKPDSPVHQGPVDQTWGTREFYADDPDGNTVIFQKR